jgi:hypothetical protein
MTRPWVFRDMIYSDSHVVSAARDGELAPPRGTPLASSPNPICICGHARNFHEDEQPYECWGCYELTTFRCDCRGFEYKTNPMDGEPRRAGLSFPGKHSAEMPTPSYPSCSVCRRTLIPGALYADGWIDTDTLCHTHQKEVDERNYEAMLKRAGKALGYDRESTEGCCGR